jgi:hypothetical protein
MLERAVAVSPLKSARVRLVAGLLAGFLLPVLAAEAYVRLNPPEDIHAYLGDSLRRDGIYRPDPVLRAGYRSASEYVPFEAPRIADLQPLNTQRPTWLFFGNSFARGLSASVRERIPSHRVLFYRESKDEFHLRVAQFRLLLESGLRPDHVFFTVIPIEVARYVLRPLDWVYVSRDGALSSKFRLPGEPLDSLLNASWLARVAWVRSRMHHADPTFRMSRITETVPQGAIADFDRMLGALADLARTHKVPVTIILLPDRRQIFDRSSFALQNQLASAVRRAGLDAFDPRDVFLAHDDKRSMYLPDWHYSPVGDRMLLDALLGHLKKVDSAPVAQR